MSRLRSRLSMLFLAAAALLALSAPRPASAQVKGLSLQLSPYAGEAVWAKETNLKDKPIFGGRAGLFWNFLGIEGTYGRVSSSTRAGEGRGYSIDYTGFPYYVAPGIPGPENDFKLTHLGALRVQLLLGDDLLLK